MQHPQVNRGMYRRRSGLDSAGNKSGREGEMEEDEGAAIGSGWVAGFEMLPMEVMRRAGQ